MLTGVTSTENHESTAGHRYEIQICTLGPRDAVEFGLTGGDGEASGLGKGGTKLSQSVGSVDRKGRAQSSRKKEVGKGLSLVPAGWVEEEGKEEEKKRGEDGWEYNNWRKRGRKREEGSSQNSPGKPKRRKIILLIE